MAAEKKSPETFYLMKITEEEQSKEEDHMDDYGHRVKKGVKHLQGVFFERECGSDKRYKLTKKRAFFYRESIVYPFVQLGHKKGLSVN